jgi:hypothetical protein
VKVKILNMIRRLRKEEHKTITKLKGKENVKKREAKS